MRKHGDVVWNMHEQREYGEAGRGGGDRQGRVDGACVREKPLFVAASCRHLLAVTVAYLLNPKPMTFTLIWTTQWLLDYTFSSCLLCLLYIFLSPPLHTLALTLLHLSLILSGCSFYLHTLTLKMLSNNSKLWWCQPPSCLPILSFQPTNSPSFLSTSLVSPPSVDQPQAHALNLNG